MTDPLTSLVERLEKAAEGDRKLDRDIFLLVMPDWMERGIELCDATIPRYTTSLDAALTLLPAGAEYTISTLYGITYVELPLNGRCPVQVRRDDGNVVLAFMTACLRARQQGEGND